MCSVCGYAACGPLELGLIVQATSWVPKVNWTNCMVRKIKACPLITTKYTLSVCGCMHVRACVRACVCELAYVRVYVSVRACERAYLLVRG